jgi:hypothetical protein
MLLLVLLFIVVLFQLISCPSRRRHRRESFISSLSPIPSAPTPVSFLQKDSLNKLLSTKDGFFESFFDYDYYARNVKTFEEYIPLIKASVDDFTNDEKVKLQKCTTECDRYLQYVSFPGFDGTKASNIVWTLGKVKGKLYEYGLPHTRLQNLIVLSDTNIDDDVNQLTRTLIHEKIHLYQQQYPNDIQIYLDRSNIGKYKKRQYNDLIRVNPDLDDWIYKDLTTGFLYDKAQYNSKSPINILDVKNTNQLFEHPFEKMAVEISRGRKY